MLEADPYEIVVGLEVHAQLLTHTKLFCGDTTVFGAEPNTQVSAISLGHPGTLPRLNEKAIGLAVKLGLACQCEIVRHNFFARKNYFYPDLPKGYQISQHTAPICRGGVVEISVGKETKQVRLNRIHIEEDAGKSVHEGAGDRSNLDFNRAGMPLLEIVTEPDLRTAEEAFAFVTQLRKLVRHLGVCDGNMEQGSLRCDVNISVRKRGDTKLGTKVEVKNLNSIRFIKKAIEFEAVRLKELHSRGEPILQQTRGFQESDGSTYAIRTKEDEDDYRYFPEPDLPPFRISEESIERIRTSLPPLENQVKQQLQEQFQLTEYDAGQLAGDMELSGFFFQLAPLVANPKTAANWIIGPVKNHLATQLVSLEEASLSASALAALIKLVEEGGVNYGVASQKIFPALLQHPGLDVRKFAEEHQLFTAAGAETDEWVEAALRKHSQKIGEYKKGKKGLLSLFVGEVMKLSGGKADARMITEKIIEKINSQG